MKGDFHARLPDPLQNILVTVKVVADGRIHVSSGRCHHDRVSLIPLPVGMLLCLSTNRQEAAMAVRCVHTSPGRGEFDTENKLILIDTRFVANIDMSGNLAA